MFESCGVAHTGTARVHSTVAGTGDWADNSGQVDYRCVQWAPNCAPPGCDFGWMPIGQEQGFGGGGGGGLWVWRAPCCSDCSGRVVARWAGWEAGVLQHVSVHVWREWNGKLEEALLRA